MNNKLIMQINYAERPGGVFGSRSIDDVCAFAKSVGFDGIEFRGNPPRDMAISFREYAEQIAAAKKKHGLSEILFGMSLSECTNPEKRDEQIAAVIEKVKIAREVCGTEVCNANASWISSKEAGVPSYRYDLAGAAAATETDWEMAADAFARVAPTLEAIGMRFAFETHMGYVHDLPANARRLVDMIGSPSMGINLDYGNTVYFPNIPTVEEAIDICGDKLFYTHLKNSVSVPGTDNRRMATALGDGQINHRVYMEKLCNVGYTGLIGIEAPRQGDKTWFAKCDMAYLKDVLADF